MRQLLSGQQRYLYATAFALLLGATPALAQGTLITGTITRQEGGGPLLGANVVIAELNVSVGTNEQGVYRIQLPPERVRGQTVLLRVRSIGFKPVGKSITLNQATITENFTMEIDVNRLSEVVVTGVTGATEKRKLAFTVDAVDASQLPVPGTNAIAQLQGKITGAQIVTPNGRPGTNPQIVLRGPKSLNAAGRSQQPLVIVDGVILNGDIGDINPQDIENIEVIKGAAAATTYGSRAANGVITITTKTGKNASPGNRFNVRSELGFSDVATEYPFAQRHMMMLDHTNSRFCIVQAGLPACSRTVDFEEEAFRVNDQGGDFSLVPYAFQNDAGIGLSLSKPLLKGLFQVNQWPKRYNPVASVKEPGQFLNANVDMSGRAGNTGYFASISNLTQQGAIKYLNGYRRNGARLNLDQRVGDDITMQLNTTFSRETQYADGSWFRVTRTPAGVDLNRRDSKGRLFVRSNPMNQGTQNANPLYDHICCFQRSDEDRFLGAFTTRYAPLSWLDFEANASVDRSRGDFEFLRDRGFRTTSAGPANLGQSNASSGTDQSYNMSLMATARRQFGPSLQTRWNARYLYERQDANGLEAAGQSTAIPGRLTLFNNTASFNINSGRSSVRAVGILGGGSLDYKDRYIVDGVIRRDGSSLFGENQRWHNYYRGSLAWRASEEAWFPAKGVFSDFKVRASVGTAGGRPRFSAQYETFDLLAGGAVAANALGNKELKPETTTETEYGVDAELWSKYGLNVTYARSITADQLFQIPPSVSSGFSTQWKNAGTLDNKTWEVSLNMPIISKGNVTWTSRLAWDRTRSVITSLGVPPFFQTLNNSTTRFAEGERLGNLYGKVFIKSCSQLPAAFQSKCGPGQDYQANNEGFIVWVGAGNTYKDGITKNLWQAVQPGCIKAGVALAITGDAECRKQGGTTMAPWGIPQQHWGMPMVARDSAGTALLLPLGNNLPDYRWQMSHSFQYKRFTAYGLVDASIGNKLFNQEIHWSLGDFNVRYEDQDGKTVEDGKPLGYYWRGTNPDNPAGVGGFYDILGSNNVTVEDGTYYKLRELTVGYQLGRIGGIGDWTINFTGRNLWTSTDFLGWDPEVGATGGNTNSAAVNAQASFQYPQTRTFTLVVSTRF
ncbi:MAG: SusC/RagA family TonB-linked outer membrane protein [Gemmatimonadaceae bacterium]